MQPNLEQSWQVQDRFLELHSHWMTLIGEHLQDHQGNLLEYWRIEKADSVVVLPIILSTVLPNQAAHVSPLPESCILLPAPSYRPGVGQATFDFPGGRVAAGQSPEQAAIATLKRELGIEAIEITQLSPLNSEGWAVNSSFSNQKLFGFVARFDQIKNPQQRFQSIATVYPVTSSGIEELLQKLVCLQCRVVLLEWWLNFSSAR